jgi:Chitobiase/beta-hexosaminidase C-terminal domain
MAAIAHRSLIKPNPSVKVIYYTTDGTIPTTNSTQYPGNPLRVSASQTITAVASDGVNLSAPAAQTYICGVFTSVTLTIQTGSDDARTDSAIQATLAPISGNTTVWCLKPSDNGTYEQCQQSHPGYTWEPWSWNPPGPPTIALSEGVWSNWGQFTSLKIEQAQFPGFGKGDDNWDLYWLKLTGNISDATAGLPVSATLLDLNPQPYGYPADCYCIARFKHPHSNYVSTVTFTFGGTPQDLTATVQDDDGPHAAPYCGPGICGQERRHGGRGLK